MKARIALEDGFVLKGFSFGACGTSTGEVVFNTSMAGYQEVLTDPSYKGQIVTMTYPLIGNYGVNSQDSESAKPHLEGFVVKECSRIPSNWRSTKSLPDYLKENNIIGIEGVDTRALTRHIRLKGSMKAVISTEEAKDGELVRKARDSQSIIGRDLVKEVTCRLPFHWNDSGKFNVTVIDCGVKFNILRKLSENKCRVFIVPADFSAKKILDTKPDGILISNGPGDPEGVPYLVETVKQILRKAPLFGICFGNQIIGLAMGGKTYKLKFGHHGGNHPVKDLRSGSIAITTQNHNFCLDMESLDTTKFEATHVNLNDGTLEGISHKEIPVFSVQFHPESGPGPHDAHYLFSDFIKVMEKYKD
ncbi:MAG: glutamine-hydrolyzing carbamoyl-phosphate synthase small subunit [Candidatus Omnitrophica bacterium]|nr:glutamine-hydrolyzing carbamoyl-phosphate synthase small subunit [Candidatus Omnitrophota bacterium]MBD3269560.1 glutamine-hydrolyzing carbamoyl-phosphate synthase small subunit [Candidatus Omnitrophota bacterium]